MRDDDSTLVQRTGLQKRFYTSLSLSHRIEKDGAVPLEVSICHRPRRPGCAISDMSSTDYKRATLAPDNTSSTSPLSAAMDSAPAPATQPAQPAQPAQDTAMTPADTTPAPAAEANTSTAPDFMAIFKKAADSLPESERKVFIDAELSRLRELEDAHKQIQEGQANTQKLKEEHKKQIGATMDTIRNFFL